MNGPVIDMVPVRYPGGRVVWEVPPRPRPRRVLIVIVITVWVVVWR
jgi:hypothetical protein